MATPRFMRLMVFFDLPVKTKPNRRAYTRFHAFLIHDGYDMLQFSVYARVCNGLDAIEAHTKRLQAAKPEDGSVRYLVVTEKQYANIQTVVGAKKRAERHESASQLTFF